MACGPADNIALPLRGHRRRSLFWAGIGSGLILIVAGVLRTAAAQGDFWLDEIWSWNIAEDVSTSWEILTNVHHDNNHYLNTWWMHLLGPDRPWAYYRILSAMSGIGAVAVAGLIGNRHSTSEAVTAMLLISGSYLQVHYSSEARGYSSMILFAMLSFYLLDKSLNGAGPLTNVCFACSSVLGFLSHLQFVFCYAGLLAWSLWRLARGGQERRRMLSIIVQCHLVPILFLAWLYSVDISRIAIGGGDESRITGVLMALLSLTVGGPSAGPVALVVAAVVALSTLSAIVLLWREGADEWVFYLTTVFIAPICIPVIMQHELFFVRYFLICSTFALLLLNHIVMRVVRWGPLGRLLCVCLFLSVLLGNAVHVTRLIRLGRGQYQQAMRMIDGQTRGPMVLVSSDHPFRNPMVLTFYQRKLADLKPISYLPADQPLPGGPEWFLLHDVKQESAPVPAISDHFGNRYRLVQEFPYAGLSGWKWAIYRNVNRLPGDE